MKKLKLQLGSQYMLTKAQMKTIVGGVVGDGDDGGDGTYNCPNGEIYVTGYGWCHTSSCSQAQTAYNNGDGVIAICNGVEGKVTGYCCAHCSVEC